MKLKRLEIQGFKSFAERTVVHFDQAITGVVGPNGCGKSNIVDAIRWVMGEQSAKHLRGRNMEDVIFAGTEGRSSSAMASVELTLEATTDIVLPHGSSSNEVSVGRILYRTGESEYLINRQPVRLKDVTDFFLGTGVGTKAYSIIEQGRVGQIITAKPEDRRFIVEEAAGISKFKVRKEAALRKMEATRLNLSRLNDILTEIGRQKESLERQAKRAQRFKVIKDELASLDLKLAAITYEKNDAQQKDILQYMKEHDGRVLTLTNTVTENEAAVEAERLRLVEVETEWRDVQQEVFEWDNALKLCESKLHTRRDEIARCEREAQTVIKKQSDLEQDLTGSRQGLNQIQDKVVSTELDCVELEETVAQIEEDYQRLETEALALFAMLDKARAEVSSASSYFSELAGRRAALTERRQALERSHAQKTQELETLTQRINEIQDLLKNSESDLSQIHDIKNSLGEQTQNISELIITNKAQLKEEQTQLEEFKQMLLIKKSRLESLLELERNFEGYQDGPKNILKHHEEGNFEGVMASVADVIETEARYEDAVTAVLGERVQSLIVRGQAESVACVEYLKTQQAGRGTFIPLSLSVEAGASDVSNWSDRSAWSDEPASTDSNVLPDAYISGEGEGLAFVDFAQDVVLETGGTFQDDRVDGYLSQFVNFKAGHEKLGRVLFGDVLLAKSLGAAFDAWADRKMPVVTYDGEFISREGLITGGSLENSTKSFLEKKREIKDLTVVVDDLIKDVHEREKICQQIDETIQKLSTQVEEIKTNKHAEDLRVAQHEKDLTYFSRELQGLVQHQDRLRQQLTDEGRSQKEIAEQLVSIDAEEKGRKDTHAQSVEILETRKDDEVLYRAQLTDHQERLTKEKIRLAQLKQQRVYLVQEADRLAAEQTRLTSEMAHQRAQQELLGRRGVFFEKRVAFLEKNINRLIKKRDEATEQNRLKQNELEELNTSVQEREHALKDLRSEWNAAKEEINQHTIRLTEIRAELSRVSEQMFERYQMVLSDVYKNHLPHEEIFNVTEATERALALRQRLSNIGSVNIEAIDELNSITERFEFLNKQKVDLDASLDALEKAIQKINRTTKERFQTTFDLINEKFTKLFPRLFQGGHASLTMTNPDDVLETGIDIIAQPPGKKLQSISLLSGGEKALTAVSLLFAIFLIKPSPFCLLDEVDAPLDDANVDRYNDIVKEISSRTQFIVITHNKRTMQVTDCLYGVTMQEAGVSSLVSVQLG